MSPKKRLAGLALASSALVALALLIAMPRAEAQIEHLAEKERAITGDDRITPPGFTSFCVNDPCPGQTCDNLNDRCVGNATLQPKMGDPLVGLSATELARFEQGRELYDLDFVQVDGLGPIFNQTGCGSCHSNPLGGSGSITVTRFGNLGYDGTSFTFDPLTEFGGSLWNKNAISADCAETIPIPETNYASERLTNSALGFGLVELIDSSDIEFNDFNPPAGVSGRAIIVPVLESPGETTVGRFGWKNQLGTIESFGGDAMLEEMGITNRIFPEDNAPNADPAKLAACDTVADPEDVPNENGDDFLTLTTEFQRFLAPPPQTPRSGMTGETLFFEIGCGDCHMASFTTPVGSDDDEVSDVLQDKPVNLYSDLLLHDMGSNADYIEQGDAGLTEMRTTMLWGLRIRDPLWHDGRVAGGTFDYRMFNSILLHDGFGSESAASAQAYMALSVAEQNQVIAFLDSLGRREFDLDGDGVVDDADVLLIDDCVASGGPFTPDDLCAIADPDQDGFITVSDLELLDVALGVIQGDDEGGDEGDDESGDDGAPRSELVAEGSTDSDVIQNVAVRDPNPLPIRVGQSGDEEMTEAERATQRFSRRDSMRRGR